MDLGPYVDISVKLVLHFFLGIRINVKLVSEKVDSAICNMQLVNKLRRKQCVQTANVIYQSGQKNPFRLHISWTTALDTSLRKNYENLHN